MYDPNLVDQIQVQSFIEKIILITEHFRENEYDWNYGPKHCVQQTFSPTLQQRMDEISYLGKMAMLKFLCQWKCLAGVTGRAGCRVPQCVNRC